MPAAFLGGKTFNPAKDGALRTHLVDWLTAKDNPGMDALPQGLDFDGFCHWLARQRNDLLAPAMTAAPQVALALRRLRR